MGVNCIGDATRILNDFDITIFSPLKDTGLMCDLMVVMRESVGPFELCRPRLQWSFARLAAHLLNLYVDKGECISNWEAPQLSSSQLRYAAADVHLIPFFHRVMKGLIHPHLKLKAGQKGPVMITKWEFETSNALLRGDVAPAKRGRPNMCSVSAGGRIYFCDEDKEVW